MKLDGNADSFVRIDEEMIVRTQPDSDRLKQTIHRLGSIRRSVYRQAEQELRALGPAAFGSLLAAYRRVSAHMLIACLITFLGGIASGLGCLLVGTVPALQPYAWVLFYLLAPSMIYGIWFDWRTGVLKIRLGNLLVSAEDVGAIGPITDMMCQADKRQMRFLRHRLLQLLPLVETASFEAVQQINPYHINELLQRADSIWEPKYQDEELMMALLRIYPRVGDDVGLGKVEKIARHGSAPMRSVARECLPRLRERLAREQDRLEKAKTAEQLLRASSNEAVASEVLLRAATGTEATATQQASTQLLRPLETEARH